jgi:hypothetical protein
MNLYLMEIDIGAPIFVVGACHRGSGALIISRALSNFGGVIHAQNPSCHGNSL